MITANGLAESPEITRNPHSLVGSMLACGVAFRRADPARARDALRRGLKVAQDSGCRTTELAVNLAVVEGAVGDTAPRSTMSSTRSAITTTRVAPQ